MMFGKLLSLLGGSSGDPTIEAELICYRRGPFGETLVFADAFVSIGSELTLSIAECLALNCLPLIVVAAIVIALTDRDIQSFEQMRSGSPNQYLAMKRTLKFNGPLVAFMCCCVMIGSPIAVLTGDANVPMATFTFAGFSLLLWLSLRWTRWAYAVKHID